MSKEEQDAGVMMARHRRLISSGLLGLITVTCLSAGQSSAFGRSVKGEETDKGGFIGDFFQRFASRDECRFPCQMRERERECRGAVNFFSVQICPQPNARQMYQYCASCLRAVKTVRAFKAYLE